MEREYEFSIPVHANIYTNNQSNRQLQIYFAEPND